METQEVIICKPVKEGDSLSSPQTSADSFSAGTRIAPEDHESLWSRIEQTYIQSFPESERRPFPLVRRLVDENPAFTVYALFKESGSHRMYAGFLTAWDFNDFVYIEHFAIDEAARNGGIGGKALKQFLAACQAPVVLEVEIPTDDLSKRRIGFYERLGFRLDTHVYHQPPYQKGGPTLEMRLMTYGDLPLSDSFEAVETTLYKNVYGV